MKNIEDFDNRTQLAIDEYILVLFKVSANKDARELSSRVAEI